MGNNIQGQPWSVPWATSDLVTPLLRTLQGLPFKLRVKSKHLHVPGPALWSELPPSHAPNKISHLPRCPLGSCYNSVNLDPLSGVLSELTRCQRLHHNCLFLTVEVSVQIARLHLWNRREPNVSLTGLLRGSGMKREKAKLPVPANYFKNTFYFSKKMIF